MGTFVIKVIEYEGQAARWISRCEHLVSHSGTGLTAKPQSNCRKNAVIDFHGKKICQQHAGTLALAKLMNDQEGKST